MGLTIRSLGFALGALSIVSLSVIAFKLGLGPAAQLVFSYYDNFMHAAFSWAEPFIEEGLVALRALNIHLQLYSHWKHIFVLLAVYFGRDAADSYGEGHALNAVFRGCLGLIVALATSVGAGTIAATSGDSWANCAIAAVPIFGILFYELVDSAWRATWHRAEFARVQGLEVSSWWEYFRVVASYNLMAALIGALVIAVGLQLSAVQQLPSPGLALLSLYVVVLAIFWLMVGATRAGRFRRTGEAWWHAFRRMGATRVGLAVLSVFVGAAIFLALNAGLAPLGL